VHFAVEAVAAFVRPLQRPPVHTGTPGIIAHRCGFALHAADQTLTIKVRIALQHSASTAGEVTENHDGVRPVRTMPDPDRLAA
jgi:hypothetical protein